MSVTEKELVSKSVAPRVTLSSLEENIIGENYFTIAEAADALGQPCHANLRLVTMCVLTLKNGFTVTGQSACADADNFNPDIGRRLAKSAAQEKIWPLMGYELRTKLDQISRANPLDGRIKDMGAKTYIGSKVIHAAPINRADYNTLRGWELPADENGEDEGYLVQYADQNDVNVEGFTGYVSWSPKEVFEQAYKTVG